MPFEHKCPRCGSDYIIVVGTDDRKYTICSNTNCDFNYNNQSRELAGKNRRHFKLTKEDYVSIHGEFNDFTVGYLAKKWGVSSKQIRRILNLNLSRYAEEIFGEIPNK